MREYHLLIIGGGLSGLAAGIRFARFGHKVLILEKHSKAGGLNSYYYRRGRLFETGLHAITNYAPPEDRHAPLNRLLRQLKIRRSSLNLLQQKSSVILFPGRASLCFSNDFSLLHSQIAEAFPDAAGGFEKLVGALDNYDPFIPGPKISARDYVASFLHNELLVDMLFCPIMFYGGSEENDMDLAQFVILFRSIFQEGFFRPAGTIKDFLDLLLKQYRDFDGEIEFATGVEEIIAESNKICGVRTSEGEEIGCRYLISTAGLPETKKLFPDPAQAALFSSLSEEQAAGRLSFVEAIYHFAGTVSPTLPGNRTIIFYNLPERFSYRCPDDAVDLSSGVICFPGNFQGSPHQDITPMRVTHLANYDIWRQAYYNAAKSVYPAMKNEWTARSREAVGKIIGNCAENIVYEDSFTPVTIERYTSRMQGAVYGSPEKIKDGRTDFANLYIAGTDQGYLGITGSMLSGITVVNQQIFQQDPIVSQ